MVLHGQQVRLLQQAGVEGASFSVFFFETLVYRAKARFRCRFENISLHTTVSALELAQLALLIPGTTRQKRRTAVPALKHVRARRRWKENARNNAGNVSVQSGNNVCEFCENSKRGIFKKRHKLDDDDQLTTSNKVQNGITEARA